MRLTLRQLHIFLAIAEHGSTTAAAGQVALSQSATSAALNELEAMLEVHLFDRVGKRLVINDNGRLLLPQARQMLDAAATIERQFAEHGTATGLHLGASTTIGTYLLPGMLAAAFPAGRRAAPHVAIANTADIATAVANFELDLGFVEGPCHDVALQVEPWIEDELVVVASPGHPLLAGDPGRTVPLEALRDAGWLLRESGSGTREAVEQALVPHLHSLRSAGEFSNSEAIKHAAAHSLGIACLSRLVVADFVANGRLVALATPLPVLTRHFFIVHHRDKVLSGRLQAFLAFCRTMAGRSA
jgi:DNA-binding transcriptional LysR family regulator